MSFLAKACGTGIYRRSGNGMTWALYALTKIKTASKGSDWVIFGVMEPKKVGTWGFGRVCYALDFQGLATGTFWKSRDKALWRPRYLLTSVFSVYFCDVYRMWNAIMAADRVAWLCQQRVMTRCPYRTPPYRQKVPPYETWEEIERPWIQTWNYYS